MKTEIIYLCSKGEIRNLRLRKVSKEILLKAFRECYGVALHGKNYIFLPLIIQDFREPELIAKEIDRTVLHEILHNSMLGENLHTERILSKIELKLWV